MCNYQDPFGLCAPACTALAGAAVFGGIRIAANLLSNRPWTEGVAADVVLGAAIGGTLGAAAPLAAEGSLAVARAAPVASAVGGGSAALASKANHLFGSKSLAKHNLSGLLDEFGGNAIRATSALQQAFQTHVAQSGITNGPTGDVVIRVAGQDVTMRGVVIDGAAKLGTAFIPK